MDEEKNQKIAQNKALLEKYPILMPYYATMEDAEPYDYETTALDYVYAGWRGIFLEMCDQIMAHLKEVGVDPKEFHFFDIKEKYGTLRIEPVGYCDKEIYDMLFDIENRCMLYCPNCGAPSKCATNGYILFLCPDCAKLTGMTFDWLTPEDSPRIVEYNNETKQRTERFTKYDKQFRSQWDAKTPQG